MAVFLKALAYGGVFLLSMVFLWAIPKTMLIIIWLRTGIIQWPGPPTINSSQRDFETEMRLGIPPKPLFSSFFANLAGVVCSIAILLFFALYQIDQGMLLVGFRYIVNLGIFAISMLAGYSWVVRLRRNVQHLEVLMERTARPKPAPTPRYSRQSDDTKLTNRAFHEVEKHNFEGAIPLLEQAIQINPRCGDAYNELAFIHGKFKNDLDLAEKYARQAVECNPQNPKFINAINGIQIARIQSLHTRSQIRESIKQRLLSVEQQITAAPEYPPLHLTKAVILAMGGEATSCWEDELQKASALYWKLQKSASGFSLSEKDISEIMNQTRNECIQMKQFWEQAS